MRKRILPILGKVWRKELTPEQVANLLMRAGPFDFTEKKREKILEILSALKGGEVTTNEAEEWLEEEGVYENSKRTENLCQID